MYEYIMYYIEYDSALAYVCLRPCVRACECERSRAQWAHEFLMYIFINVSPCLYFHFRPVTVKREPYYLDLDHDQHRKKLTEQAVACLSVEVSEPPEPWTLARGDEW